MGTFARHSTSVLFVHHSHSNRWNQQPPFRWGSVLLAFSKPVITKGLVGLNLNEGNSFQYVQRANRRQVGGAFLPRRHHSCTFLKRKTAVLTDQQTWLERIQHRFTDCIVWGTSNAINSETAVNIATIFKHSPANTSYYKLSLVINETATTTAKVSSHNFLLLCLDTQATRSRLWSTANIHQCNEKDLRVQLIDWLESITMRISRHRKSRDIP